MTRNLSEEQKRFLQDMVASLNNREPLTYLDQTRYADLIRAAFPAAFTEGPVVQVKTVAQAIHDALVAKENCEKRGNSEWRDRWQAYVTRIAKECLPSGAGIDTGVTVDGLSGDRRGVALSFSFHHMNDVGSYDGWTEHTATVYPSFTGLDIRIRGPRLPEIGDNLYETFDHALRAELPTSIQP